MNKKSYFNSPKYKIFKPRGLAKYYAKCCRAIVRNYSIKDKHFPMYNLNPKGYNDLDFSETMKARFIRYNIEAEIEDFTENTLERYNDAQNNKFEKVICKINKDKITIRRINRSKSKRNIAKQRRIINRLTKNLIDICRLNTEVPLNYMQKNSIIIFGIICCDYYFRYSEEKTTYCYCFENELRKGKKKVFEEISFN